MPQQLSCIGEISAPVHGRRPVTTRGNGPTVEDGARSAGTSEISASRRSSRIPSRRASTDALIITGDTPTYRGGWLLNCSSFGPYSSSRADARFAAASSCS
jgi:hypothetical protein